MIHHICPDRLCPCGLVTNEDRRRQTPVAGVLLSIAAEADRLLTDRWAFLLEGGDAADDAA